MWISMLLAAILTSDVARVERHFDSKRMVPLLSEVLRFSTVANDQEAQNAQKAWLQKTARDLGLLNRQQGYLRHPECIEGSHRDPSPCSRLRVTEGAAAR